MNVSRLEDGVIREAALSTFVRKGRLLRWKGKLYDGLFGCLDPLKHLGISSGHIAGNKIS